MGAEKSKIDSRSLAMIDLLCNPQPNIPEGFNLTGTPSTCEHLTTGPEGFSEDFGCCVTQAETQGSLILEDEQEEGAAHPAVPRGRNSLLLQCPLLVTASSSSLLQEIPARGME